MSLNVSEQHKDDDDDRVASKNESSSTTSFPTPCPSCHVDGITQCRYHEIPFFQAVIIMTFLCNDPQCGYKSNEVKPALSTSASNTRDGLELTLTIASSDDYQREVLKSDSSGICIPALELELGYGGLGGFFSTVEGLLEKMYESLSRGLKSMERNDDNCDTDGSTRAMQYQAFLDRFLQYKHGEASILPFQLILKDPLGQSYIGPVPNVACGLVSTERLKGENEDEGEDNKSSYGHNQDPNLHVRKYTRSFSDNERLGLNDINTDQYNKSYCNNYHHNSESCSSQIHDEDVIRLTTELEEYIEKEKSATTSPSESYQESKGNSETCKSSYNKRGPDHPHIFTKGTTDNDNVTMGPDSLQFPSPDYKG